VAVIVQASGTRFDEVAARAALKSRLAPYKQPKRYVVTDALPRNAMGKVQKNLLRTQWQDAT